MSVVLTMCITLLDASISLITTITSTTIVIVGQISVCPRDLFLVYELFSYDSSPPPKLKILQNWFNMLGCAP